MLKLLKSYRQIEQERLFRLYRSATTVLVMCYGNICRSPFAGMLLGRIAESKVVTSTGTYLIAGRKSPTEAKVAAATFGIDLKNHCSRVATEDELKNE